MSRPTRRDWIRPSNLFAFAMGLCCCLEVQLIGRLFFGEVLLLAYALGFPRVFRRFLAPAERRIALWFLGLAGVYLIALVFSDLYRGTAFQDLARGWSRAVFFVCDILGLIVLSCRHKRRFLSWLFGAMISQIGVLLVVTGAQVDPLNWKLGFGEPMTVILVLLTSLRTPRLSYLILLSLACANLFLDYRSLAGFAAVTALLMYVKLRILRGEPALSARVAVAGLGLVGVFSVAYFSAVALQYQGDELLDRRGASNAGRIAALAVSADAIKASPFVGYGSWARNSELFTNWAFAQADLGGPLSGEALLNSTQEQDEVLPVHSQILQGWFEAGLGGMVFFLFLLIISAAQYRLLLLSRVRLDQFNLVTFWTVSNVWAFMFSPFGGFARIIVAVGMALLLTVRTWLPIGANRIEAR